jgi:hypothetical protein
MTEAERGLAREIVLACRSSAAASRILTEEGFTRTEIDHALLELPRNRGKVAGVDGLTTLEREPIS